MCSPTMQQRGVSENSNKVIRNIEREIIRSEIERFNEEYCKYFLQSYEFA
jgi:hypothetical protein